MLSLKYHNKTHAAKTVDHLQRKHVLVLNPPTVYVRRSIFRAKLTDWMAAYCMRTISTTMSM